MLIKTHGIVLQQVKYSESSLILDVVTRDFGRQSFVISGVRKPNSRISASMLRPAMMIDLVAYYKEGRTLHRIKELSPHIIYKHIPFDVVRGTGALFMVEVFRQVLPRLQQDEQLYRVLYGYLNELDNEACELKTCLHRYIIALLEVLGMGIQPGEGHHDVYFHVEYGTFVSAEMPGYTATLEESQMLAKLQQNVIKNIQSKTGENSAQFFQLPDNPLYQGEKPIIPGESVNPLVVRRGLLDVLIKYMTWHIPGFRELKSVAVLRDMWDTRGDEFVS